MQNRFHNVNYEFKNQGYVDCMKDPNNIRFMSLNLHRFGQDNYKKMNIMYQAAIELEIDVIMLSTLDRKWTMTRTLQLKKQFQQINKNVEVIISDSSENITSKIGWLLGGIVTIFLGKVSGMVNKKSIRNDERGGWSSFILEGENEKIQVINLYRNPDSTSKGLMTSWVQYNRVCKTIKAAKQYRKEILRDLTIIISEATLYVNLSIYLSLYISINLSIYPSFR